jgi:nitroreductase
VALGEPPRRVAEKDPLDVAVDDHAPAHRPYSRRVELIEILERRRMVRHYTGEPVPRETLERIAQTVRRAPSGGYSQGQRLVAVDDPDVRARIAALIEEPEETEPWISSAPALIIVCCREGDYHERYNRPDKLAATGGTELEWPAPYWFVDAGAAMMLVLLAAIDEGLAAGVFGVTVDKMAAFKQLLAIPEDVSVVAAITIGQAAPDPEWSKRTSRRSQPRRSFDEIIRWNRWD